MIILLWPSWGGFQSLIVASLIRSIPICPSLIIIPGYSTSILSKKHFSSFKNNLCSLKHSNTFLILAVWSSWLLEWIRILTMYMMSHFSAMRSLKMWFMSAWKVVGELHRSKNITVGLNSSKGMINAAFHLSSGLMRILLYPHQMSILVKIDNPLSLSIRSEISGSR